jgi:anti-sigma B factor antagonist
MEDSWFAVTSRSDGSCADIELHGELDLAAEPAVLAEFDQVVAGSPEIVVIDLRGLTFMDSTGIRLLLGVDRHCRAAGRGFTVIRNGTPAVDLVLELCEVEDRLDVRDLGRADAAIASAVLAPA